MPTAADWLDITRELTAAPVYPGDPMPVLQPLARMAGGDICNTTALSMCLHNGTHMDAPCHFVPDGGTVESISPDVFAGVCRVLSCDGALTGADVEAMPLHGVRRLLLRGEAVDITPSAAFALSVLAERGLCLIGVEPQSVAVGEYTAEVHRQLLGAGIVLLEGLVLAGVEVGDYTLYAFPLKIAGADGAPVRAFLAAERHLDVERAFAKG